MAEVRPFRGIRYSPSAVEDLSAVVSPLYDVNLELTYEDPDVEHDAHRYARPAGLFLNFARTEGIIPAPEPSHAIHVAIEEALKCKETGEAKNILFLLCGHGYFDMSAYDNYLAGQLEDFAYPEEEIKRTLAAIPQL